MLVYDVKGRGLDPLKGGRSRGMYLLQACICTLFLYKIYDNFGSHSCKHIVQAHSYKFIYITFFCVACQTSSLIDGGIFWMMCETGNVQKTAGHPTLEDPTRFSQCIIKSTKVCSHGAIANALAKWVDCQFLRHL